VIGLPGDIVAMQDNRLSINGVPARYRGQGADGAYLQATELLAESAHAMQVDAGAPSPAAGFGPVTVPSGQFLVLGDNRDNSKDSRYIGFVPRREIIGRARHVVLSLNDGNYYLPRADRLLQPLDAPGDGAE
jgi:signal peptidase I